MQIDLTLQEIVVLESLMSLMAETGTDPRFLNCCKSIKTKASKARVLRYPDQPLQLPDAYQLLSNSTEKGN